MLCYNISGGDDMKRQYNYDAENDVLYISKIPNIPCVGTEEIDGVVIRRSYKDNKVIGVTIFDVKQMISYMR